MDQTTAKLLGPIDLKQLQAQWSGGEIRALVAHLTSLGPNLSSMLQSELAAFDSSEVGAAAEVTHEFQALAKDPIFWSRDAGQVLGQITTSFEDKMNARGHAVDDAAKFNMFQSLIHGFALTAVMNPHFRSFIGI